MTTDWKRAAIIAAESEARACVERDALEAEVERLKLENSELRVTMNILKTPRHLPVDDGILKL